MAVEIGNLSALEDYPGLPYDYTKGPDERAAGHDPREGLNCQFLVHAAIELIFGFKLPPELKSKEIFEPNKYFFNIDDLASLRRGDIAIFARLSRISYLNNELAIQDPQFLHLAVATGRRTRQGSPFFIHASHQRRKVGIWSLDQFAHSRSQYELVGLRRFYQPQVNLPLLLPHH